MTLHEKIDVALHERAPALEQLYLNAPLDRDLVTDRQREAVFVFRGSAVHRRGNVLNDVNQVNRLNPRYEEQKAWRDVLAGFVEKAEAKLVELETVPREQRTDADYRTIAAWRDALRHAQRGPEWMGGSMCVIAQPLSEYLNAAGFRGNPFAGRGGLLATEERVEVFRRNLAAVEERIDRELATPLPTLELPKAIA